MDPASLALGAIPLVIQLTQTIKSIKDLAAAYKSAETELKRLFDRLDYVEIICQSLKELLPGLEVDCLLQESSKIILFNSLYHIISACYDRVLHIHRILLICVKQKTTRNPLKTIGSRFLRHKNQVHACTDQLDGLLSLLQLQITSVTLAVRVRPLQKTLESSLASTGSSTTSGNKSPDVASKPHRALGSGRHNQQSTIEVWRQCWTGVAFLQRTEEKKTNTMLTNPEFSTNQNDSTFTFGLSLINWHIKFAMRRGSLAPSSFSFHLPRVISLFNIGSDFGRLVKQAFLEDNLEKVQEFFQDGILTPATVISVYDYDPDRETSLLGLAVLTRASRLLQFLTNQTSDIFTRSHLCHPTFSFLLDHAEDPTGVIEYINIRQKFITPGEFAQILTAFRNPSNVKLCIEACQKYFANEWEPFNNAVWDYVRDHFKRLEIRDLEGWAALVADAVSRGLNIAQYPSLPRFNGIFVAMLHYHHDSDSILDRMHQWIDMLALADVNTDEHVRIEIEFCFATWDETPPWNMRDSSTSNYRLVLTIMESRGRQLPCCVQRAKDECHVQDLLHEFQHFMTPITFFCHMTTARCKSQYQARKKGLSWDFDDKCDRLSDGWPFWFPLQQYPTYYGTSKEDIDWVNHEMELMQRRFERKQYHKWHKAGRQGEFWKPRLMPGSWVEEA